MQQADLWIWQIFHWVFSVNLWLCPLSLQLCSDCAGVLRSPVRPGLLHPLHRHPQLVQVHQTQVRSQHAAHADAEVLTNAATGDDFHWLHINQSIKCLSQFLQIHSDTFRSVILSEQHSRIQMDSVYWAMKPRKDTDPHISEAGTRECSTSFLRNGLVQIPARIWWLPDLQIII